MNALLRARAACALGATIASLGLSPCATAGGEGIGPAASSLGQYAYDAQFRNVRSAASGRCVETGFWTPETTTVVCEPRPAASAVDGPRGTPGPAMQSGAHSRSQAAAAGNDESRNAGAQSDARTAGTTHTRDAQVLRAGGGGTGQRATVNPNAALAGDGSSPSAAGGAGVGARDEARGTTVTGAGEGRVETRSFAASGADRAGAVPGSASPTPSAAAAESGAARDANAEAAAASTSRRSTATRTAQGAGEQPGRAAMPGAKVAATSGASNRDDAGRSGSSSAAHAGDASATPATAGNGGAGSAAGVGSGGSTGDTDGGTRGAATGDTGSGTRDAATADARTTLDAVGPGGMIEAESEYPSGQSDANLADAGPLILPVTVTIGSTPLFDFNQSAMRRDSVRKLDDLVGKLRTVPYGKILAVGYADPLGTVSYNLGLSQRRAESVKSYLESKGVPAEKISVEGRGLTEAYVSLANCGGLRREPMIACLEPDRRVEVTVTPVNP